MQDFHELKVWQKSHLLTLGAYRETACFPPSERYGLTSQVRRAAASVPANIAEGCGRGGIGDFGRFLQIAMGSASELEYHLLLARDLGFLGDVPFDSLNQQVTEVKRMLASLIQRINRPPEH